MTAPPKNIGAFFDLDGTLLPAPSLEWRFISYLLERDEITTAQIARWLAHFATAILRNPHQATDANKHYLAGIKASRANDWAHALAPAATHEDSLPLFAPALARIKWHHAQGHHIFLITGTLAPLAKIVAQQISRRIQAPIEVQATELEIKPQVWHSHSWLCSDAQWTGRRASQHMSHKTKSRTLKALAATNNLDLTQSYAYGNTTADVPMLESVAHPQAVNPTNRLTRIAHHHRWPILHWQEAPAAELAAAPNRATTQFATKASQ
ncbi:MAG: HAD-IB family phosphatase [Candidatus Acidiferrales bacterium]